MTGQLLPEPRRTALLLIDLMPRSGDVEIVKRTWGAFHRTDEILTALVGRDGRR